MKYYIEVTLLPNADIPLYFLWEKLYQQIHLALVEVQSENRKVAVGVAFPEYGAKQRQLGTKLRLFSLTKQELEKLDLAQWLSRLMDYVHIAPIRNIPENSQYAVFRRIQPKRNNAKHTREAKRKAKREGISLEQALQIMGNPQKCFNKAPFIHVRSLSSGNRYRLMIEQICGKEICHGEFSTYGLSSVSTVPIF